MSRTYSPSSRRDYVIDLYHDAGFVPRAYLADLEYGCFDYRLFEFRRAHVRYHGLVYQMGNSAYHQFVYQTLLRHPGVVTLHDLSLVNFQVWYARQPGVAADYLLDQIDAGAAEAADWGSPPGCPRPRR